MVDSSVKFLACCAFSISPPSPKAAFIVIVAKIISITIVITNATNVIPFSVFLLFLSCSFFFLFICNFPPLLIFIYM